MKTDPQLIIIGGANGSALWMALKFKHRKIADYLRPTFQTKHSFPYASHKGK